MKKRLHLITAMYVSKGHGEEYVRNFCSFLKSNFEITLYVASLDAVSTPEDVDVEYINVDYKNTEANNFSKFSFFAPYFRSLMKQYYSYKYYGRILKSKKIEKGDLVYIMDYDVIPLISLIKGLKKLKTISYLWVHSARFESKDIIYGTYKRIFKNIFNNYVINHIHSIVVNGELIKSRITRHLNIIEDRIEVIQYPSEISHDKIDKQKARQDLGIDFNENTILFFGMLRKDKNIETLIRSVSETKTSPTLIIAGSEASVTKEDILNWIQKYDLKNYILDIDYISEQKMALYYSCSDALVLFYNLESASQSGPLSLAREFELPAIVANVGEIGYYVESNSLGITVEDAKDFTEKIDWFFNNKTSLNKKFHQNLKAAKEKYSWSSASKKYLALFNEKRDL